MKCQLCERKFKSNSSFYRHSWSDKHLLVLQIKEYEKEIKELESIIAQNQKQIELLETSQYHTESEKRAILVPDLA